MSDELQTWLIIILVIAVVVSNMAVLKYSNKYKLTQFGKGKRSKKRQPTTDDDQATDKTEPTKHKSPQDND